MKRFGLSVGGAIFACAGLCAPLSSAAPPILDRVPADASVIVVVPDMMRMQEHVSALARVIEAPMPIPSVEQLLLSGGISAGVDGTRPIALFMPMTPEGDEFDPERAVVLLPISSYADLMGNFEVEPSGGVDEVVLGDNPAFVRDVGGGYAALGPNRELIEGFKGTPGGLAAHTASMGSLGDKLSDSSDVAIIVNIESFRPILREGLGESLESIQEAMAMAGQGGNVEAFRAVIEPLIEDGRGLVLGFSASETGVTGDMAVNFREDAPLASVFDGSGNATTLLSKLPRQDFLFAFAMDMRAPFIRETFKQLQGAAGGEEMPRVMFQQMDNMEGQAMVIGASPGALMGGGLLVNSVAYVKTTDPKAYLGGFKAAFEEMNGKTLGGMTVTSDYQPEAATAGAAKVDAWSMKMKADATNPMAAQGMMMMFGPAGGPNGYAAAADGGVVMTYSKNSGLMATALDVASGKGEGLTADPAMASIGAKLPEGRILEGYIGVKSIFDMVMPMMAMMGAGGNIEVPATMPPIGMAVGGRGGQAHGALFVPAEFLKITMKIAGGSAAGPMMLPEEDDGAGQPRF